MTKYSNQAARELLLKLEGGVESNVLIKVNEKDWMTNTKIGNQTFKIREIIDQYKDNEDNLSYRAVHHIEEANEFHELYIDSFDNGFLSTI